MKTQKVIFSLVFLLALFLAACSPQVAPTQAMSEKDANAAESMDVKDDAMMDDQMTDDNDDQMMSEKDDGAMADKDEDMMTDTDDAMMDEKDDDMADDAMADDDMADDDMADDDMADDDMADDDMADDDMADDDMADDGMADDDMADDDMADDMADDDMADDDMADDMAPDWFNTSLTNARTGETFTIADFKGKVVLVETLAIWCSNCLKQQGEVLALHDLMDERDDFVSLGIDIDPREDAAALSSYISQNGFRWLYTVAPPEVAREIAQLYGDQFLNPPSTPMLIIDREGEVHPLPFGIKSAESLLEALQPFLDAEM